jgi:GDP-L-fucose synthase
MRIAVLGATGLVGRHLIEALLDRGDTEIVATYRARPPYEMRGLKWRHADLMRLEEAMSALEGVQVVLQCAGKLSTTAELRRDPIGSVTDTLRIGINVLEAAARQEVDRLVMISSCTGYPEVPGAKEEGRMFAGDPPATWFGVGWMHRYLEKQLEWYCRHLGRIGAATALRPTLIYGPYDDFKPESAHFVPSFIHRVIARETPIEVWGDGTQTRNLIHAADVAAAVVAALAQDKGFEAYNIATPNSVSVNEVLTTLLELDGFTDARVEHFLDKAGGASALDVSGAAFSARFSWAPSMSLRDGLADTLDWYRRTSGLAR